MSNLKLARRWPGVNVTRGNEEADHLAEKGRIMGTRPDVIPEGMDAYVVVSEGSKTPLSKPDVRRKILNSDKEAWASKACKLVHQEEDKWWDDEVTHVPLSNPKINTWVRRARYHNRTTTVLLSENLSNKTLPRFQHVKDAVALQQCPIMGCTETDTQDHIFTCPHSAPALAKISSKVKEITRDQAKVPRYWLSGKEVLADFQSGKKKNRVKGIHHNRKWGSLGYFPKGTLVQLQAILGRENGIKLAMEVNRVVVESLFNIESERIEAIRSLINANKGLKDPLWVPP